MKLLVTGGAGYIGSHFLESFIDSESGHDSKIWVIDDLSGGHSEFIDVLRIQAKKRGVAEFHFDKRSLLEEEFVTRLVKDVNPDVVFHFAGKISVGESVKKPDLYFNNNVKTAKILLSALEHTQCRQFVFSSTAAVYQPSFDQQPLREEFPLGPSNPYGENKLQVENMLEHAAKQWGLGVVVFRYFNAAGASPSGRFGEWHEPETHLIPLLLAKYDETDKFKVFGSDYSTRDGTCVRDYIHVSDLASAHVKAVQYLKACKSGFEIFNLGTNRGVTVLEMLNAASVAVGRKIPFDVVARREGDPAVLVASAEKAQKILGWEPKHSELNHILMTADRWMKTLAAIQKR
ncbi:MAG: UDP-glucose 4-epimerase GalE [Bdellovibrionales bacterium]|nr:UDP-glucose 4-epimerase GalE [Bdellovibrionales bacterium]